MTAKYVCCDVIDEKLHQLVADFSKCHLVQSAQIVYLGDVKKLVTRQVTSGFLVQVLEATVQPPDLVAAEASVRLDALHLLVGDVTLLASRENVAHFESPQTNR